MIFYFSATGNSKYVATRLREDDEDLISVTDAVKNSTYRYPVTDERLGFVFPTYFWSLPSIVVEFLEKLELTIGGTPYVYFVATYGTTSGAASAKARKLLRKKGIALDGCFDVRMPDTWTPIFDLSDPDKVARTNRKAEEQIDELRAQVRGRVCGKHMGLTAPMLAERISGALYEKQRKTTSLSVDDTCISCGLCAKKCPVQAIAIREERPVWVKEKCALCLGCLHRCPTFSIQCGPNTRKHGQYLNPHVKV